MALSMQRNYRRYGRIGRNACGSLQIWGFLAEMRWAESAEAAYAESGCVRRDWGHVGNKFRAAFVIRAMLFGALVVAWALMAAAAPNHAVARIGKCTGG